jgi:DNA-binding transcriptional LysR family regulator
MAESSSTIPIWPLARLSTGSDRVRGRAVADPFLRSGQLVRVLENCTPSFERFFLYYPGHRQVPVAPRALIDMLRTARGSPPAKVCSSTAAD